MLRTVAGLILLLTTSACMHLRPTPLTYTDQSGWADQIEDDAVEAYPYAQMSLNAYGDPRDHYELGPNFTNPENADNDRLGFAYSLFERRQDGRLVEVIIAFRGTELDDARDMVHGNLAGRQNPVGLDLYDRIWRRPEYARIPITVTGHSLGGGIATYVSLRRPGANAYVFNSSPRFSRSGPIPENRRLSIVERGEILKLTRALAREAPQTYVSINCVPGFGPIYQHGIRLLGDCLTQIAAWRQGGAKESLRRNHIAWPSGLPQDP